MTPKAPKGTNIAEKLPVTLLYRPWKFSLPRCQGNPQESVSTHQNCIEAFRNSLLKFLQVW